MMNRKWTVRVAIAVPVVLLAWGFFRPKPTEYLVAPVTRGTVLDVVTSVSSGTLEPSESRIVTSDTGGVVVEVRKHAGEAVAAGEVVVALDRGDLADRLRMEEGNLRVAETQLREATVRRDQTGNDYAKAYDLFQRGIFSRKQAEAAALAWRAAKSEVETVTINVDKLRTSLGIARRRVEETELKAPLAGTLKSVSAETGQTLLPKQPAFEVMDASKLVIEAVIDESDARKVAPGQPVRITADALPDQVFQGRLAWVAPVVSLSKRANRGVEVRIEIDGDIEALRVGMSVDIEIVVGRAENVLAVPTNAVFERDGKPAVFVFDRQWRKYGKAHARPIQAGIRTFNQDEVRGGLEEGELVVLSVDEKLADGMKIRGKLNPG